MMRGRFIYVFEMREELSEELERHIVWLLESDEREEREKELERLGYGLKVGMVELRGMLLVLLGRKSYGEISTDLLGERDEYFEDGMRRNEGKLLEMLKKELKDGLNMDLGDDGEVGVLSRGEVERLLSKMGRGEGVSGKDQLQALSMFIRMKGWLGNGGGSEEEMGSELSELLKGGNYGDK